jgi:hypothetical protein
MSDCPGWDCRDASGLSLALKPLKYFGAYLFCRQVTLDCRRGDRIGRFLLRCPMSAFGTKRTSRRAQPMSAFGGKAETVA